MSDWGMGIALQGLYGRQNRVDQSKEELASLQAFKQEKLQDKAVKEADQLKQIKYQEEISKFADTLLGPDRDKINEKAKFLQGRIKEQIASYGGDMGKFFENGGHTFFIISLL